MCPIITAAWMYTAWCNSGVMHGRSYQWRFWGRSSLKKWSDSTHSVKGLRILITLILAVLNVSKRQIPSNIVIFSMATPPLKLRIDSLRQEG
jgi:hypothetical protein